MSARTGRTRWTDDEVERWIGLLLRWGVIVAAVVAAIGGVVYMFRWGDSAADFSRFQGVPRGLNSVGGVVTGAFALHSRWIIQLGLLLLIATPIARVALSLVAFALQRDRTYMVVTTIVLALLLFSLLGPAI